MLIKWPAQDVARMSSATEADVIGFVIGRIKLLELVSISDEENGVWVS